MQPIVETPESGPARLQLAFDVEASSPQVWRSFTDARALEAWWPEVAQVDATVGGAIVAGWPSMGWTMRGRYTDLRIDELVEFTWSWDHEPDTPERLVRIEIAPVEHRAPSAESTGVVTHVVLTHGDYEAADGAERSDHLAGWLHFLPRLGEAIRLENDEERRR